MTLGDPPTWLVFAGVIAAMVGGIFIGDALSREWRAMIDDDRRAAEASGSAASRRASALRRCD
jgi:hypothetical protein